MVDQFEALVIWLWRTITALAGVTLLFGAFSACAPQRSLALYQWIMARCNWRVVPIDEPREVGTTRLLGLLLVGLSVAALWLLARVR